MNHSFLKRSVHSLTTFKTLISQKIQTPEKYLRLVWNGKNLESDFDYLSIPDNSFIDVLMTLKGGMEVCHNFFAFSSPFSILFLFLLKNNCSHIFRLFPP